MSPAEIVDPVTAEVRAVLDALQPTEWWSTERPDTVVVSLDATTGLRPTVAPAALPAASPYETGENTYPHVTDA